MAQPLTHAAKKLTGSSFREKGFIWALRDLSSLVSRGKAGGSRSVTGGTGRKSNSKSQGPSQETCSSSRAQPAPHLPPA